MDLEHFAAKSITEKLRKLSILKPNEPFSKYYPHSIGHYLGLDIHDGLGILPTTIPLEPGMIITVEPGIYIPDEEGILEQFKGQGIRIEDDILITENGIEILTKKEIKDPNEIERLMSNKN